MIIDGQSFSSQLFEIIIDYQFKIAKVTLKQHLNAILISESFLNATYELGVCEMQTQQFVSLELQV